MPESSLGGTYAPGMLNPGMLNHPHHHLNTGGPTSCPEYTHNLNKPENLTYSNTVIRRTPLPHNSGNCLLLYQILRRPFVPPSPLTGTTLYNKFFLCGITLCVYRALSIIFIDLIVLWCMPGVGQLAFGYLPKVHSFFRWHGANHQKCCIFLKKSDWFCGSWQIMF